MIQTVMSAQHPTLADYGDRFHKQVCSIRGDGDGDRDGAMKTLEKINDYVQAHGPDNIRQDVSKYLSACKGTLEYPACYECNPPKAG